MKKMINYYKIGVLVLAAVVLLTGQPLAAQDTGIEKQLTKLQQKLNLNEEQTAAAREILRQEDSQKTADRETYKKDALALIRAAWERRKTTYSKIEPLLDEGQREELESIKRPHPVDRELFELTEGLLLTEEQVFDIEGVLIQFHNEFGGMGEMLEGGGALLGPPPSGKSRMGMPMGGGRGIGGIMKEAEAKKAKAIKKTLTEEQKVMYEQIRKDRKEKMKERIKEMKERFKR